MRRPIRRGDADATAGPSARAPSTGGAAVVDLAARRRAAHLGELRTLLVALDRLWSALWRSYPGREREVVELHLRFDGVRDAIVAWAQGDADHPDAPRAALAAQLEGAAVLGAPDRGAETWRSLCRQLEALDDRVAALDPATPR